MLNQQVRKHYNKTLGSSVINTLMSPPSLDKVAVCVIVLLLRGYTKLKSKYVLLNYKDSQRIKNRLRI